jgi:hypothetical protein
VNNIDEMMLMAFRLEYLNDILGFDEATSEKMIKRQQEKS